MIANLLVTDSSSLFFLIILENEIKIYCILLWAHFLGFVFFLESFIGQIPEEGAKERSNSFFHEKIMTQSLLQPTGSGHLFMSELFRILSYRHPKAS